MSGIVILLFWPNLNDVSTQPKKFLIQKKEILRLTIESTMF